jgi:hypothetical protein
MARVKKSLADLRAAERFISDVGSARKTATARQNQDMVAVKCSTVEDNISVPTTEGYRLQMPKEKCATYPTSFRDRPLPDIPSPIPNQPTPQAQDIPVDAPSVSTLQKKSGSKCRLAKYTLQNPQCLPSPIRGRRRTNSSHVDLPVPASPTTIHRASEVHAQSIPSATVEKRKRISSVSFRSGRSEKKKKSRLGAVGKVVRAVLRLKKDH